MSQFTELRELIEVREAKVCIMGQGYVGLSLAMGAIDAGFFTYGFDVDDQRVRALASGRSHVLDVPRSRLQSALSTGRYHPCSDPRVIHDSQVVVICVPTPLRKSKDPDVSFIIEAASQTITHLSRPTLVILESTSYPGTTEELLAAEIRRQGYRVGEDVFVCFSPERVDPGNKVFRVGNTPKVIGGITRECTALGALFYSSIVQQVIPVSSARVAEMVKLLENTFRAVNIGLVNELALLCERMGIDIWEAIDAAATKPFGYVPFYPGPGLGGHCIPLDPLYLSWKARSYDFYNKLIELASDINGNMPRHVVVRIAEALNLEGKAIKDSRILILGMAYKKDTDDIRESPSLEVFRLLRLQGAAVNFHDPHVKDFSDGKERITSVRLTATSIAQYDCVALLTNHTAFDYPWIARNSRLIVDTRNAFGEIKAPHIIRIGAPIATPDEWSRIRSATKEAAVSGQQSLSSAGAGERLP